MNYDHRRGRHETSFDSTNLLETWSLQTIFHRDQALSMHNISQRSSIVNAVKVGNAVNVFDWSVQTMISHRLDKHVCMPPDSMYPLLQAMDQVIFI